MTEQDHCDIDKAHIELQSERLWEHSEEPDGDSANNVLLPLEDSFPIEQGEPLSYREALRDAGRI